MKISVKKALIAGIVIVGVWWLARREIESQDKLLKASEDVAKSATANFGFYPHT